MRFAVVGSGAVGGYYGGRLAAAGADIHFLFRSDFEHVLKDGLAVTSCDGNFHVGVNAYNDVTTMPKADVVIVALKGTETHSLKALLPPLLHDESAVLCLQNGLGNEEFIASMTPRVIAGSAFICSEKTSPGHIEHTAAGALRIGWLIPSDDPLPEIIAAEFVKARVKCGVDAVGKRIKWTKLVWNIPFNGLSVFYGGVTTDVILADPTKKAFALQLMHEVVAAAKEDGIELDPALIETNMKATERMGAYRTSMMVDFLKGRPLEVETILGEPWRRGTARGQTLPGMHEVYAGVVRMNPGADF